jgi:hypothetical protein
MSVSLVLRLIVAVRIESWFPSWLEGRKRQSINSQMTPSLLRERFGRAALPPMVSEI